jgi:PAS domain S-box-containing protein
MKRFLCIDDNEQNMEAMLKLLREHGFSVSESSGEQAFLTDPTFCSTDSPGSSSVKETVSAPGAGRRQPDILDSAASGEALRSEESFQRIFNSSSDAILVTRIDGGVVMDSNESFRQLSGYGREEMLGQNALSLTFFLNPDLWTQAFRKLEAEGEVPELETRILRKDGLLVFVFVSLRRAEINGIPCHVMTIRDRSCKASKGTMAGQQNFLNPELESLLSPDADINREEIGRLIDFQALQDLMNSFYKITHIGIGINDIKGNVQVATGWQDVCTRFHRMHPETLIHCLESDSYFSRNIGVGEFTLYKCRNNLWDIATPLIIGGRHIANIFLGQFFFEDEIPDYEFFRNQAVRFGFDVEEYLAALDRVPRWSRETVENVMEFYTKLAVMISRLSIGNIRLAQALAEQKRISEELSQANLVVENSPVVLFRWRAAEGWPVELVSANVTRFGYTKEELLSGYVPFSSLVHPDDLERVGSEVQAYSASGIDQFRQEYRIVARDGTIRWIDDHTVIERDAEGSVTHYQGIVIDITDRKLAENALRESTDRLQSIFRVAPIGIGVVRDRALLEVNTRLCEMTGYSQEELVDRSSRMLYSDWDEFERVGQDKYRQIKEKGTGAVETRWRRKDGSIIDIYLASTPMDPSDLSKGVIFTALDITERRRAEDAIHQSEEKFRTLFMSLNEGFYLSELLYDENGTPCDYRYLEVNPKFEQIMGIGRDQIIGKRYKELVPVDTTQWLDNYFKVALTGEPCTYEFYSNEFRIHFETYAYQPAKGQVSVLIINVTERKWAEAALRESEEKFRVLAETSPAGIILYQGEKIIYANSASARIFGYSVEELLEMTFWERTHEDFVETVRERGRARLRGENVPNQYECRFVTKGGETFWAIISVGCLEYRGKPAGIVTLIDVTETKRAEQRIQASLAEKVVMLKEIHHRVKNNLQIISSLLELQSDTIADEDSRRFINESQNRIRSMALVHEKLYHAESFASINFGDYIDSLTQYLFSTLVSDPDQIFFTVDAGDFLLGIDEAIPCGLIVNELVSNSLKHAFPDGRKGEISVRCHTGEEGLITLTVSDNGVGLPPGLDFRNTETLGLQLVTMLVKQLRGDIEVDGAGTTFVVHFRSSGSKE